MFRFRTLRAATTGRSIYFRRASGVGRISTEAKNSNKQRIQVRQAKDIFLWNF